MAKKTLVEVTVKFPGIHFWAGATPPVEYLQHPHRHTFHVTARKRVVGLDREIEFIQLRQQMLEYLGLNRMEGEAIDLVGDSCEMIADRMVEHFDLYSCSVSEDGEFGATVYAEEESK